MLSGLLGLPGLLPAAQVWVTDSVARVRPHDAPQPLKPAVVKAARNEFAPFQTVVHGGTNGLKQVNAVASDLRGVSGRRIPAAHAALFRENYVEVKAPSPRSTGGAGWYPDALIPLGANAPQARFRGAPFDVAANANQPLWVDLFVPKDAAPGDYSGTIDVTARGRKLARVKVKLTVWNFTLPDTTSMRSDFGGLRESDDRDPKQWHRFAQALASHRISPLIPGFLMPKVNADGSIDPSTTHAALKDWITRYHVTGFRLSLIGKDPLGAGRQKNRNYLRAMYAYLRENGWEKMAYVYVLDEPNTREAYEQVRLRASFIHEAQPGIKVLCTESATPDKPEWGTLIGSVDIWVPIWCEFNEKVEPARLAAGDEIWSYTALCQGEKGQESPFWQLDFALLNYRIPAWISWRYGITGLLYWSTVYWERTRDVWTLPLSFDEYNYEGVLLFPGADAGVEGYVESMRLKQIREGFEDYEYFKLLADAGAKLDADQVVHRLARSWMDWDTSTAHLDAAREELARLILSRSH